MICADDVVRGRRRSAGLRCARSPETDNGAYECPGNDTAGKIRIDAVTCSEESRRYDCCECRERRPTIHSTPSHSDERYNQRAAEAFVI
jgi:hypothetical protein